MGAKAKASERTVSTTFTPEGKVVPIDGDMVSAIFTSWNEQYESNHATPPVVTLMSTTYPRRLLVIAEADLPRVAEALAR